VLAWGLDDPTMNEVEFVSNLVLPHDRLSLHDPLVTETRAYVTVERIAQLTKQKTLKSSNQWES
jgi:hypothetical protein